MGSDWVGAEAASSSCGGAASGVLRGAPRAKWIGDEWRRTRGLATLLHGLIPRLLNTILPFGFPKIASLLISGLGVGMRVHVHAYDSPDDLTISAGEESRETESKSQRLR